MILSKAKCDEPTCQREFDPNNGGYAVEITPSEAFNEDYLMHKLGIEIARIPRFTQEYDHHACGIECLFKLIRQACDDVLGQRTSSEPQIGGPKDDNDTNREATEAARSAS